MPIIKKNLSSTNETFDPHSYLNKIREEGEHNMFDAAGLLVNHFGINMPTARRVLSEWMQTMWASDQHVNLSTIKTPEEYERCSWIRMARKELNLTQKSCAKLLGVAKITVSQWEQFRRCPGEQTIKHMVLLLEIKGSRLGKKYGI